MKSPKRYLVTSALPYANGPLHIGHLAGAYLPADIFVRYLRLTGKDVVWVCGSDEYGAAITIRAKKEGITPQEIIDKYDAMFRKAFNGMGISFDIFHRTSSPIHTETTQEFFRTIFHKGEFIEKESEQYFDETTNQFLADRYISGVCPNCANPEAYGDQCERCGTTLSPMELLPPIRSTMSGATPVLKPTTHWYLPLDKYNEWLKEWVETGILDGQKQHDPHDWKTHVLGQCKSWLETGLQPRAMTRDLDWGIDVPHDIPHHEGKKIYVWMDAPIGYISATKQWALDHNKDWKLYWQDTESALIHFIGKDNIVFHCLIFPAILKVHGGYVLPVNVPANQFMNLEGRKLSTSKNWAVWVHEYLEEFPGKEDVLRYNMIKNMPEQRDSEFTWKGFQETNNTELVNNLANFINRVVVLTNKYYAGKVPAFDVHKHIASSSNAAENTTHAAELKVVAEKLTALGKRIIVYDFRGALQLMMDISTIGNQALQFNEPWKRLKEDPQSVAVVMNLGLQIVATLSLACRPFLPFTSDKIREVLKLSPLEDNGEWNETLHHLEYGKSILSAGHTIGEPIHLFSRIPDEVIDAQIKKLESDNIATEAVQISIDSVKPNQMTEVVTPSQLVAPMGDSNPKSQITIDDFAKIDIRTGKIVTAEKVPKADKLLKLTVDLGFEVRTIVSGLALHFTPEELPGQEVLVLANLAPRVMRGIESNGMILLAENEEGKLAFVSPKSGFGNGFIVK